MVITQPPDWTSIDWAAHTHDAHVDGRRVRHVSLGAGPPLLFIHGLGGSWQSWLLNLPDLARDHLAVAVDLPGFGGSDELPPPAEMATHADTLVRLLDQLGIDRPVVVAHSMGGLVGLHLALRHPDRLTALVLVASGGIALGARRQATVLRALTLLKDLLSRPAVVRAIETRPRLRRAVLWAGIGDPSVITPRLAHEMLATFAAPGFIGAVAAGARDDVAYRIGEVGVPARLVWGERDRLLPVRLAREMAVAMRDARLEVMAGVGHCPMIERPGRFNALLRDAVRLWTAPSAAGSPFMRRTHRGMVER